MEAKEVAASMTKFKKVVTWLCKFSWFLRRKRKLRPMLWTEVDTEATELAAAMIECKKVESRGISIPLGPLGRGP